jgi:hypothetical protein
LIKALLNSDVASHYVTVNGKSHLAILKPFNVAEPDNTCFREDLSPIKDGHENSIVKQVQL